MESRRPFFPYQSFPTPFIFAGVIFLLFLIGYIMQVNASSTKAYALRDAQVRHEELIRANDRLGAEIDRLRSLSSIMERQAFLDLVPVKNISYILTEGAEVVAVR